jgi:hypothetical protein
MACAALAAAGGGPDPAFTAPPAQAALPSIPPETPAPLVAPQPASRPATQPATVPIATDEPYDDKYLVVVNRSIFARGGTPAAGKPRGPAAAPGPEAGLGLKGIFEGDGRFTAFVEDLASRQTRRLHVGDSIGAGRIKSMTLAMLEYEAGGKSTQVQVGQNLLGAPLPPPQPPTSQPAAPPQPPGGPQPPPGAPGGPGGPMPPGMQHGGPVRMVMPSG